MGDLNIAIKAHKDKEKKERQARIYQAYLISRWVWQKNVDIEKALKDMDEPAEEGPMTDDQMLAQVKALNALFGGTER